VATDANPRVRQRRERNKLPAMGGVLMVDLELCYLSATELAQRIRSGAISPVDAVKNSLARIDEVQPKLNCFCFIYPEEALGRARAAEAAATKGEVWGPLHGVPIAIKDLTPTKGKRTTMGSHIYEHWVPDRDAAVVTKLLAAGAIMVGKTATPEFAYSTFTESPLWGITRNPWNRERTPGGSSGGSAVAVATGCVALAEGSDMGGSVRIPASFSGVVGLKPSFGRIPFEILPSQFDSLSHFGPLARMVEDAALFLAVAQGPDERDIQTLKPALDVVLPLDADLRGMRIALSIDLGYFCIAPEVETRTRSAADALRGAGAVVEEVDLGWTRNIHDAWLQHWGVYLAAFFGQHLAQWRDKMDPNLVELMDEGFAMGAVDFKRIEFVRTRQWQALGPILERFDALLCPTMSRTAPEVGRAETDFVIDDAEGRFLGLDLTLPFNFVSQCPALSVPFGFDNEGLPVGVQIVGRRYDDLTPLRIGKVLEAAIGGHKQPPL
jgi:Asp-tRNA(Asn)/Glu-tRNA(Gln) amidotransferase A subunit family amidase